MGEIYTDKENNMNNSENENSVMVEIGEILYHSEDKILYRDSEIERIYNTMNRVTNKAILLVGDYGIGKRSVIDGYVNMMGDSPEKYNVISFDFQPIFKMTSNRKEFELCLNKLFTNIEKEDERNILNINDLGHLINFNCFDNCGFIFLNSVIREIEDNGLRVIATTTTKEYFELESHFPKILDYFTILKLSELTKEQSIDIAKTCCWKFEELYNLNLPDNICNTVFDIADKYVKGKVFPKKGFDLMDEMCSYIVRHKEDDPQLRELNDKNSELKIKLVNCKNSGDINKCIEINNEIDELNKLIEEINENRNKLDISENDALEALGSIVGVPMTRLSKEKSEFLRNLPIDIKKDIIGQDDTIDKIVKNIRRNQLGLRKKSHSAGNYIFIGSTGVGKTALAKSLAKNLYGSEESLLRFDMSEFQTEIDVTKLIGSAPGYVGYKESGLLVKGLAKKPECVILFDEIEKAHPKIYDLLLQLLDEGSITGSDGIKVDGSKALIIFTSNIGVKSAKELSNPLGFSNNYDELKAKKEESIMRKALSKRFSPEFLNRLDSICYFNNLQRTVLESILNKEISEMNSRISTLLKKEITLNDDVKNWLLDKVENEHNGARPIIRLLEQEIEEEVANLVIDDSPIINSGTNILTAYLENEKIVLR